MKLQTWQTLMNGCQSYLNNDATFVEWTYRINNNVMIFLTSFSLDGE